MARQPIPARSTILWLSLMLLTISGCCMTGDRWHVGRQQAECVDPCTIIDPDCYGYHQTCWRPWSAACNDCDTGVLIDGGYLEQPIGITTNGQPTDAPAMTMPPAPLPDGTMSPDGPMSPDGTNAPSPDGGDLQFGPLPEERSVPDDAASDNAVPIVPDRMPDDRMPDDRMPDNNASPFLDELPPPEDGRSGNESPPLSFRPEPMLLPAQPAGPERQFAMPRDQRSMPPAQRIPIARPVADRELVSLDLYGDIRLTSYFAPDTNPWEDALRQKEAARQRNNALRISPRGRDTKARHFRQLMKPQPPKLCFPWMPFPEAIRPVQRIQTPKSAGILFLSD